MDARIAQKTAKKNLDMQKKDTKKRHAVGWRYRREGVFKHRRRKTPQNEENVKGLSFRETKVCPLSELFVSEMLTMFDGI